MRDDRGRPATVAVFWNSNRKLQVPGFAAQFIAVTATPIATIESWYRRVQRGRALDALSADQLKDIGYSSIEPKPILEVDAGLMTKLMSMR